MNCSDVQDVLSAYLDEVLDPDESQKVTKHLEVCPNCREELRTLRETIGLLHSLEDVEPPPDFHQKLQSRLKAAAPAAAAGNFAWLARLRKAGWLPAGVAAAVFFIAISLANLISHQARPVPTEVGSSNAGARDESGGAEESQNKIMMTGETGDLDADEGDRLKQYGDMSGDKTGDQVQNSKIDGSGAAGRGEDGVGVAVKLPLTPGNTGNNAMAAALPADGGTESAKKAVDSTAEGDRKGELPSRHAAPEQDQAGAQAEPEASGMGITTLSQAKIARRLTVRLEVESVAAAAGAVRSLIAETGGVLERATVSGGEANVNSGSFQARVPGTDTKAITARLGALGKLSGESVSEENLTAEYADSVARLEHLKKQEQQLVESLKPGTGSSQADPGAQADLDKVRQEMASEQEHLATLEGLVEMTTVVIEASEPGNRSAQTGNGASN